MSTDTKKLEKVLLQDFFNKDKTYDYEEIKDKGKEVLGNNYSDGKVSGLINKLIKNNVVARVNRGQYRSSGGYKIDIKKITKESLEKALVEIKESLGQIDISNLDDNEFKELADVRNIIKTLEQLLK